MDFITVQNVRLRTTDNNFKYPETINVAAITSFSEGRINIGNYYIPIAPETEKELITYLTRKGHKITKIGD